MEVPENILEIFDKTGSNKSKIEGYLNTLETVNGEVLELLNKMLCDDDYENIREDVQHTLDGNFCRGQHLLTGLIDVL